MNTLPENPYLAGNFAPVQEELTLLDLPVTGAIPGELRGRFLRIGPNPITPPDPTRYHWFLGNGMVHGVRLCDGRALWYRNRFVRDNQVTEARGWPPIPGPRHGDVAGGVVNTNVIGHGGRTYALVEAGSLPIELGYDLDTIARNDFDGTLDGAYTAHPKRDPDTGELHAMAYYWGWEHVRYVVVGIDGRVRKTVDVPVPGKPMLHDCALTTNYVVILDLPVVFDAKMVMDGYPLPYRWHPEYGARVGLLPRDGVGSEVRWSDVRPCFVFHPLNAFEDAEGRVVLDVVRHPKMFDQELLGPNEGPPTLDRWVIDPQGGRVRETCLDDRGQEFPRLDERLVGKPHRYGYTAAVTKGLGFGSLLKHDLRTGAVVVQDQGASRMFFEPVFVPSRPEAAEDDGWVLAYVYDAAENRSDLVVLPAQDFGGQPVATIHLPTRIPFGFHGNWVPDPS
jgi:carotenoid cleavage dioxygenase